MLKAAVLILAVALMCSSAEASYYAKCNQFAKCEAKASVNIKLYGPGKCTATSKAYCKAVAKSVNCFDKDTLYINIDKCRKVDVTIDADCYAKATAKALAAASVETYCDGKGFACGKASSKATAVACATAKAIVDLKVSLGDHDNAICEAKVAAAIDAIAKAAADADAAACSKKGVPGIDNEFALAKAIEKVYVDVFASCFVYCKDKIKKEEAKVIADGGAKAVEVKSVEKEVEKNGGEAKAVATTGHK